MSTVVRAAMAAVWKGVQRDSVRAALPAFFPEPASSNAPLLLSDFTTSYATMLRAPRLARRLRAQTSAPPFTPRVLWRTYR